MRSYERSHPWITFTVNLNDLTFKTWLLLGEAEAQCQHIAGAPLRPEAARQLHAVYLSKGIHGTTSIEGNTLSEEEVLRRVQGDLPLPPSREYLGREIDNIVGACNQIVDEVVRGEPLTLTPERIADFNRQILSGLETGDEVMPGVVRTYSVGVLAYRGAPAEDCEYLIAELCRWLNERLDVADGDMAFTVAVLKAVLAHLYIAWIHPFGDGNGRTARLVEFQLLVQAGLPVPAAHLLSDFYNKTRDAYYRELARTSKPPYPVAHFVHYALRGFADELREQIGVIRAEQMQVTWENYVHELFRDHDTPAKRRQKHIVLDLPAERPVPVSRLPVLSARVAAAYAGKGQKTVTRDVNALVEADLVQRVRGGIIANRGVIRAFLPVRAQT